MRSIFELKARYKSDLTNKNTLLELNINSSTRYFYRNNEIKVHYSPISMASANIYKDQDN